MRVPVDATISKEKLTAYLLIPNKSAFLARAGLPCYWHPSRTPCGSHRRHRVDTRTQFRKVPLHYLEAGESVVLKMTLPLYQQVSLTRDVPELRLFRGDVAVLVDWIEHPSGGEPGAVLEVFNALGDSVDVVTVPTSAIAPLRADQILTVRERLTQ